MNLMTLVRLLVLLVIGWTVLALGAGVLGVGATRSFRVDVLPSPSIAPRRSAAGSTRRTRQRGVSAAGSDERANRATHASRAGSLVVTECLAVARQGRKPRSSRAMGLPARRRGRVLRNRLSDASRLDCKETCHARCAPHRQALLGYRPSRGDSFPRGGRTALSM